MHRVRRGSVCSKLPCRALHARRERCSPRTQRAQPSGVARVCCAQCQRAQPAANAGIRGGDGRGGNGRVSEGAVLGGAARTTAVEAVRGTQQCTPPRRGAHCVTADAAQHGRKGKSRNPAWWLELAAALYPFPFPRACLAWRGATARSSSPASVCDGHLLAAGNVPGSPHQHDQLRRAAALCNAPVKQHHSGCVGYAAVVDHRHSRPHAQEAAQLRCLSSTRPG
eukprot:363970-Chlamydomonas_euryale.AAC.7